MLRRPSDWPSKPREEGCSSTAFAEFAKRSSSVWNNPADRSSDEERFANSAAVP